jgi:hypothetical protein
VENDPLYLFTDLAYMDIVSDLIWTAFPALFEYLDVLYGPVRRFGDGAPMDAWKSQGITYGVAGLRSKAQNDTFE